ncbi:tryptophan 7-halogenase [Sphaerisporangium sp. NPDC005288]|uniref:tryptophan 7-halogenase n=1 Tax=Sphaerisporangium sp. NPDC005288 TaxID=3155114 RepID=UPI0033A21FAC
MSREMDARRDPAAVDDLPMPDDGGTAPGEVAVIGAGPAGCAAAIALRSAGVAVTLLCGGRDEPVRMGESLPAEARPLLRRLGVWEEFERAGHPPSPGMASAWAGEDLAWRDAFTAPLGGGWLIDRGRFDASLVEAARSAGVTVVDGARVTAVRPEGAGWRLSIAPPRGPGGGRAAESPAGPRGPRGLRAGFVVDAAGRAGVLARRHGAPLHADRLMCAFTVLTGSTGPAEPRAIRRPVIESAEHGWWYGADAGEGRTAVGLFSDADVFRRASATSARSWYDLLRRTRHVFDLLGRPGPPPAVRTVPAASHCLTRLYGRNWVAAGDAASAFDPLSSAGVVAALRSGLGAATGVLAALDGRFDALAAFQRRTQVQYTSYLLRRRDHYAAEPRWPGAPFWRRRAPA